MYRVAKGILKHDHDIGDALQEAILKAYKGLPKLRKDCYFKTWLIKITINECNAILRKQKRFVLLRDIPFREDRQIMELDRMDLRYTLESLEDDLKVVTILFYYEDLPVKDISRVLNVPEGTVKSRLSRARKKLYYALEER